MAAKKAPKAKTKGGIGAVEAYNILQKRQMSEDRILVERTSIFLLATSFLFLAFVTLLTSDLTGCIFKVLGIILPSVGILLTFFLILLNLSAGKALRFWHNAQQKIEETASEFDYMLENKITPHFHGYKVSRGDMEWKRIKFGKWELRPVKGWKVIPNRLLKLKCLRPIFQIYIPGSFLALWISSLIVAILS